jgi:hypothetical protein
MRPLLVLWIAQLGICQLPQNSQVGDDSWYGNTYHGPEFVNVLDFGACGDGVTDDTLAIQKAINHGRLESGVGPAPTTRPFAPPRRAVVYLPPGTYALSETLTLWFFTQLRGSTASPPILLLKPSSHGFGNASALKPLLATAGGTNQSVPWWEDGFHANDVSGRYRHAADDSLTSSLCSRLRCFRCFTIKFIRSPSASAVAMREQSGFTGASRSRLAFAT